MEDLSNVSKYRIENFVLSDTGSFYSLVSLLYSFTFNGCIHGICLKGKATIKINFKEYNIEENSIIFIFPDQLVEILQYSEDFYLEIMAFSADFFVDMSKTKGIDVVRRISASLVLKLSGEEKNILLDYHSFIIKNIRKKRHAYTDAIVKSLVYSLLMEIVALYHEDREEKENKVSTRSEKMVEKFLFLLKENHRLHRTVSFYANELCITSKYLSALLKRVTGKSVNKWIDEAIILSAKVLLKTTDYTILQVSEELNFPNASYFGRFFKKHTDKTPLEYRMKG